MALFTDTAGLLNSVVSNSYYGMLRGKCIQNDRRIGENIWEVLLNYRFRAVAKGLQKAIFRGKLFWSVLER